MKPFEPRLLRVAPRAAPLVGATAALGVASALLVVVQAVLLADALAGVITRRDTEGLTTSLLWLAAVVAGRALLTLAQAVVARRAAATVKSGMRRQLVRHAVGRATDPTDTTRRTRITAIAGGGLDALDDYIALYLPQLVGAVVVPVVVIAQLARTDLTAAATVAITLPLIPLFMVLVGRATEAATTRRWDALQRLSHHFLDVVEGMSTLRAFGRATAQPALVRTTTDRYRTTTMATLRIALLSSLVLETIATLSVALVAVGVGLRLVDGGLALRTGLLAILLAPEAYLPLRQVGALYHASVGGLTAANDAFALIDEGAPADRPSSSAGGVPTGPLRLVVEGVSVRHTGRSAAAPDEACFEARSGEVVCINGPSGSGKSTLLGVLLGLRTADEGTVAIVGDDGSAVTLTDVARGDWWAHVGWVDQVPYLAPGTVADNVLLGRTADDEQLAAAMRTARLPLAPHHPIGDDGTGISAGERRRLGVARAILRRPSVLLLDEPTAGLDDAVEADLLDALRELADDGALVIVVSHRPATHAAADRVVTL